MSASTRGPQGWAAQLKVSAFTGVPLIAGGLSVTVALLTSLLLDMSSLKRGWADPLNVALVGLIYLAPVAAGAAAAQGHALARAGLLGAVVNSTAGRRRALLLAWVSVAFWQLTAFAALALIAAVRVGTQGFPSRAVLLLPLSATTILLSVTALGTLLGFSVPRRATAPTAALTVFALLFTLSFSSGRSAAFSVVYPSTFYQPWLEPHAALVAGQVILVATMLLGALAGLSGGRLARPTALGAAVLALLATVALLHTDPDPVQVRTDPGTRACATQNDVTLCVWPESRKALAPGLQSLSQYVEAARPFLPVSLQYRQPGLRPSSATTVLLPSETRSPSEANLYTSLAVLSPYDCREGPGAQAAADLYTWMVARVDRTGADTTSPGYRVAAQPAFQQQVWVDQQLTSIRACPR